MKSAWPGEGVTPLAASQRLVSEALARVKPAELALLKWLCESGLVTLSGGAKAAAPAAKAAAPSAENEDAGRKFTSDEDWSRRVIFAERDRLRDANHYQVLGVEPSAAPDRIKAAYFAAAKRFHSDAFSGQELGSARRAAEELFARVSEANTVLSNPSSRGDYDVYRPTTQANVIDFGGRKGFIDVARQTNARIVPVVSIGAQETQLFLSRGERIAKVLGIQPIPRLLQDPGRGGVPRVPGHVHL